MAEIFLVAGTGGVGKSLVTMALLDYLYTQNSKILLVDSDTRTCDVSKSCHNVIDSKIIDLENARGWLELVDLCESKPEFTILINTARLNDRSVSREILVLPDSLQELNRELITFWVIGRKKDGFNFLKDFKSSLANTTVHVVKNLFFGDESVFEQFKNSPLIKEVTKDGGKMLSFPKLNPEVSDEFFNNRINIAFAAKNLAFNLQEELNCWRGDVKQMFDSVFLDF